MHSGRASTPRRARQVRASFLRTPTSARLSAWSRTRCVDWAPRLGLAYRLNDKTVIRAAYSRFYDEWADITQLSQNFGGNWPAENTIQNNGLNTAVPTVTAADPLQFGSGGSIVYPINDFSQVSQWMVDPNFQTPGLRPVERGYRTPVAGQYDSRCELRRFERQT